MADQYAYATGLAQVGQPTGYPSFQYPTASGDQNAQFLRNYALSQQANASTSVPGAIFGGQSVASFLEQNNPGAYSQAACLPLALNSQMQLNSGLNAGLPYSDFSQFAQYNSMGQCIGGIHPSLNDMQQFGQLMPGAFNQGIPAPGSVYDAFTQEQNLAGFNPAAYLQDQNGVMGRGFGGFSGKGNFNMNQRGGINRMGGGAGRSNYMSSMTDPDGLREDTVFVSMLSQNIDHETMKSQFGAIGKIKTNSRTGMPMIWIFKERGIPKGEALVTYEDPSCVHSAIKWFSEHDFLGKKIEVKQAKNSQRPVIITHGGVGMTSMGGNNASASMAAAVAAVGGNAVSGLMANGAVAGLAGAGSYAGDRRDIEAFYGTNFQGMRGGRMMNSILPMIASNQGDNDDEWLCPVCNNINYSFRQQCKLCSTVRRGDCNAGLMARIGATGLGGMAFIDANGMPSVGPMRGGGGRGGGPMRGGALNAAGRTRPAPY